MRRLTRNSRIRLAAASLGCLIMLGDRAPAAQPAEQPSQQSSQSSDPSLQLSELAAELTAAAERLDPERVPQVDQAKQAMRDALAAMNERLTQRSSAEVRRSWQQYLELDALAAALEGDDLAALREIAARTAQRLTRTRPGMELPEMVQLRNAAEQLVAAIRFRDVERTIEVLQRQMNQLAEELAEVGEVPTPRQAAAINSVVSLLAAANQAPELRERIRRHFSQPNLHLYMGAGLIAAVAQRRVDRVEPVNQCILGSRLVGTAQLRGQVSAYPLPAEGVARIQLELRGDFSSLSTGFSHPVRFTTASDALVCAVKPVTIGSSGIGVGPATATADLDSQLLSVQHHLRIVRRIAAREAAQRQPQAEQIGENRLRNEVAENFDAQVRDALAGLGSDPPGTELQRSLERLGLQRPEQRWGSTRTYAFLRAIQRNADQLAAATAPPVLPVDFGLGMLLHESLVDNAAGVVLGGRTVSREQMEELLSELGVSVGSAENAENGENGEQESFEIDFADFRPVIFEARDSQVRVGIRGTRFASGERSIERPLEVAAVYRRVETPEGTVQLERSDSVEIEFPGRTRLSVGEIALRRVMRRQFESLFPPTLLDTPVRLPIGNDQRITLNARHLNAEEGWLSVGLR